MIIDCDVTTLDESYLAQPLDKLRWSREPRRTKNLYHRQRVLLPPRHQRPSCRAEPRNELASFHSITSSARTRSEVGIFKPSDIATFKLINSSYLDSR
jgi:hypothetical protein